MRPYMIAVAGPSGAGKTCLAQAVAGRLNAPVLGLDSYYRPFADLTFEERCRQNFDDPASIDAELLFRQLSEISQGRGIEVPVYDFVQYTRRPETVQFQPADYVVMEGLFVLYWANIRELFGTRVYVELADAACFERRLRRDVRERGRTQESVTRQYQETVRPMAEQYIRPTRRWADLVVAGDARLEDSVAAVLEQVAAARAVTR